MTKTDQLANDQYRAAPVAFFTATLTESFTSQTADQASNQNFDFLYFSKCHAIVETHYEEWIIANPAYDYAIRCHKIVSKYMKMSKTTVITVAMPKHNAKPEHFFGCIFIKDDNQGTFSQKPSLLVKTIFDLLR